MTISPTQLLAAFQRQVGYNANGSNDTPWSDRYADTVRDGGFRGANWCAMGASGIMFDAGAPNNVSCAVGVAWVPSWVNYARSHGLFVASPDAKPAATIFFDWNLDGIADHVGVIESYSTDRKTLTTIECNTLLPGNKPIGGRGNGIRRKTYTVGEDQILGCMWTLGVDFTSAPVPTPVTHPVTIQQGATGPVVRQLQMALNNHGALLTVDGDFGPKTNNAVRQYQSQHGLLVDGVVGPMTWGSLGL